MILAISFDIEKMGEINCNNKNSGKKRDPLASFSAMTYNEMQLERKIHLKN